MKENLRGLNIGSEMMTFSEKFAADRKYNVIYCHARDSAVNFYIRNGYKAVDDYFDEDGIPHLKMRKTMNNQVQIESFKIVGISVRTTNENGKSMADLGQLWNKFYSQDIISKISNKTDNDIYSIYTEYTTDYTGEYTAIIGCKVNSLDNIPPELMGYEFKSENYLKYTAQGKVPDAVIGKWKEIWDNDKVLNRKYTVDFEVYGQKSQDPNNAQVDIYISTKN